jgi:hypothetical protein
MGIIPIDEGLQVSDEVSDLILGLISNSRIPMPKLNIAALFLAKIRPGLDPLVVAATITSRFPEANIPSGPLPGGTPNSMEILINILCEEMVWAIQDDMRVDLLVDPGQQVTSFGANGGGPIVTQGSNITPWLGTGIGI